MFSFLSNDPVNKNFKRNLNKLEFIIVSSMRHNAYKKNYNAGAIILVRKIKPRVNSGNIRGTQKQNFIRVYNKYASIVNDSATSKWAQKVANDPYLMKRFFNRRVLQNQVRLTPAPVPNRPRFNRPAPVPNRPRFNRPAPVPSRGKFVPQHSKCLFKKLSITGKPIFKCT
jgi:hypothetical protein